MKGESPCPARLQERWIPRRGNLIFSMFRGNDRDDCISYRDWRAEIESAMAKGYPQERVNLAMFEALEDMPKQHAYAIDSEADKMASPNDILENMDELYGVKMTFQALSAALLWPATMALRVLSGTITTEWCR